MSAPGKPQILLDRECSQQATNTIRSSANSWWNAPYITTSNSSILSHPESCLHSPVESWDFNVHNRDGSRVQRRSPIQDTSYRLHCADSRVLVGESKTRSASPHSQKKTQGKKTLKMWNVRYEVRRT